MSETLLFIATRLAALLALLALGYGAWRAIRSPLQPLATFVRAWAGAITFARLNRLPLWLVLAALMLGQALQVYFHFFPLLSTGTLIIISTVWQFVLAVFMALCAARILLFMRPMVTFAQPDADIAARFRQIARPVALWAAAVWLIGMALTVLFNYATLQSAPAWRWYVAVPAPMLIYLIQTPLILIRPALVFGRGAGDGVRLACRHLLPLLLLNFLFTLLPFLFPNIVYAAAAFSGIGRTGAYLVVQTANVPFLLFQYLAYELSTFIAFGIAAGFAPQIRFNKTLTAFYRR